jgi:hypothetical protein
LPSDLLVTCVSEVFQHGLSCVKRGEKYASIPHMRGKNEDSYRHMRIARRQSVVGKQGEGVIGARPGIGVRSGNRGSLRKLHNDGY